MKNGCPFCDYDGPSEVLHEGTVVVGNDVSGMMMYRFFVIEPLRPVTAGHRLVIPRLHVPDFRTYPRLLGAIMQAAGDYAGEVEGDCNLIVSAGRAATQTVNHMHVHIVPRRPNDRLRLPWS